MKKYPKYKDSGIPWIGEIPKEWEVKPLKSSCTCNDETLSETSDSNMVIDYIEIGDVSSSEGIKKSTEYLFKDAPSRARRITRKNDIIISTVRTYLKAISVIENDNLIVSTGFAVIRPNINIVHKYLAYALIGDSFINQVIGNSIGVSYPAISTNKLLSIKIPFPTPAEQRAIASFLEKKNEQINNCICLRERELQTLNELKQAQIANVVTKGLDPNVPMKDSGIPWIGQIPAHWEVKKISSHFHQRNTKVSDKDYPPLSVSKQGVVPQLDTACKTDNGDNRKLVCRGDFVVNSRSDRKGSCGVSQYAGSVSLINIVAVPHDINVDYCHYLFRSNDYIEEFYRLGRGIVADLWTTRYSEMKNIFIPIPPREEQDRIIQFINNYLSTIDTYIASLQAEIEHLKEYKQRLISDVVTGKIDVRDEA